MLCLGHAPQVLGNKAWRGKSGDRSCLSPSGRQHPVCWEFCLNCDTQHCPHGEESTEGLLGVPGCVLVFEHLSPRAETNLFSSWTPAACSASWKVLFGVPQVAVQLHPIANSCPGPWGTGRRREGRMGHVGRKDPAKPKTDAFLLGQSSLSAILGPWLESAIRGQWHLIAVARTWGLLCCVLG